MFSILWFWRCTSLEHDGTFIIHPPVLVPFISVKMYIHKCLRSGATAQGMQIQVKMFSEELCAQLNITPNFDNSRYFPSLEKIRRTCSKELRAMRFHEVGRLEGRGDGMGGKWLEWWVSLDDVQTCWHCYSNRRHI